MNIREHALRNTFYSSIALYTEFVLGLLTSIVIARHLGPEHFGTYSAILWVVTMAVTLTNAGASSSAIKFIAELRGAGSQASIPTLLRILNYVHKGFMVAVLVIVMAILLFSSKEFVEGIDNRILLLFVAIVTPLRANHMFNVAKAKGFESFKSIANVVLIASPLNLLMVALAVYLEADVRWLLITFVASSLVFYGVSAVVVGRLPPKGVVPATLSDAMRPRLRKHTLLTSVTATASFFMISDVEVMFLSMYATAEEAGLYKVGFLLASSAAELVPGVLGVTLLPMMARALSESRDLAGKRFAAVTAYLSLLAMPLIVFGCIHASGIITILYGVDYVQATPVFMACLVCTCFATVTQGGSSFLVSSDRQGFILILLIFCSVLRFALNVILVKAYGLTGAIIAFSVVIVISGVVVMVMAIRISGMAPDWGRQGRIMLAGAVAFLAVWPFRGSMPVLLDVFVGGVLAVLVYLPMTLVFKCWSRNDIGYLMELHARFLHSKPQVASSFLGWCSRRA